MVWLWAKPHYGGVEYWHTPEREGWLHKQGDYIRSWRKRWFVMKQGKIFWFLTDAVTTETMPRGVIDINQCLAIKGAEDAINKPFSFAVSTKTQTMYYVADSEKAKEDWINALGRAMVKHSTSLLDNDRGDYTTTA